MHDKTYVHYDPCLHDLNCALFGAAHDIEKVMHPNDGKTIQRQRSYQAPSEKTGVTLCKSPILLNSGLLKNGHLQSYSSFTARGKVATDP